MSCRRCGNPLSGKQQFYCSPRCSKLYLKSLYRKRHREQLNSYNRMVRKQGVRASGYYSRSIRPKHLVENPVCEKCGTTENIQVHHIKPLHNGGENKGRNLLTFCQKHHYQFEQLTKDFWEDVA